MFLFFDIGSIPWYVNTAVSKPKPQVQPAPSYRR